VLASHLQKSLNEVSYFVDCYAIVNHLRLRQALGLRVVADELQDVREVDRDTLEPILFLLQSPDIEVQRAASAALGNLAVNSMFKLPWYRLLTSLLTKS
jgi:HEAT repeat protein